MAITIETAARRVYLLGDTYPVRDAIRGIGGKWDPDRRAWWVGAAKRAEAEALVQSAPASAPRDAGKDGLAADDRLLGQVEYTGRSGRPAKCWWAGQTRDGSRYRLASMDGSRVWWADAASCRVLKTYAPRDDRWGRTQHQTWGRMQRFLADARAGVSRADYQEHIEGLEDQDHFAAAAATERMGYAEWRRQQTQAGGAA